MAKAAIAKQHCHQTLLAALLASLFVSRAVKKLFDERFH